MKYLLIAALLLIAATTFAQESAIELMRQNLKTGKVALMTANLPLTEKEAELFWPIYREYDHELSKLGDRRVAVLRRFAQTYNNVTELAAGEMMKESFSIARDRTELLEKYYDEVAKAVGVITAARFVQIENQILTAFDAKLIDEVPLVKVPKAAGGEKK
jgi:phytoene/squalene synthetase